MNFFVVEYTPYEDVGFVLAFSDTLEDATKIANDNRVPGREDEVFVWAGTTETYEEYKKRNA